jgi:hypothetical protein
MTSTDKPEAKRASLHAWLAEHCEFWKQRAASEAGSSMLHMTMGGGRVALEFAELVRKYVSDTPDMDRVSAGTVMHAIEEAAEYAYRLAGRPNVRDQERMTAVVVAHGIPLALSLAALYGPATKLVSFRQSH